jgi:hypothetical protein
MCVFRQFPHIAHAVADSSRKLWASIISQCEMAAASSNVPSAQRNLQTSPRASLCSKQSCNLQLHFHLFRWAAGPSTEGRTDRCQKGDPRLELTPRSDPRSFGSAQLPVSPDVSKTIERNTGMPMRLCRQDEEAEQACLEYWLVSDGTWLGRHRARHSMRLSGK